VGTKVRVEVVEDGRVLVSRVEAWEEELRAEVPEPRQPPVETKPPEGLRREAAHA